MSEQFSWTDELTMEFAVKWLNDRVKWAVCHDFAAAPEPIQIELKKFKESKQPKPEWEIVSYRHKSGAIVNRREINISVAPENEYIINCVRRLSDKEVFAIGDKFTANAGCDLTIKSFAIEGSFIKVWSIEYGYWLLKDIKKRVSLFKTEDGKDIYEGMQYWAVSDDFEILYTSHASSVYHKNNIRAFSTEEKAKNWVIENKPCLSLNDVIDLLYPHERDHAAQIVIDKIKQSGHQ